MPFPATGRTAERESAGPPPQVSLDPVWAPSWIQASVGFWFSDKYWILRMFAKGWKMESVDHKSLCSMILVSLFIWAGVVATAQVDENRSSLAIKCPQCPKNRRYPPNDHYGHLPRCSSCLRNTRMSCRKGAASVFEAFPETQCIHVQVVRGLPAD